MRYQVVLGDVYMQNGKKQEAYEIYKKVLAEEPDNAMAMYSLASYYEETGQKGLYEQQLDTLLLNKKSGFGHQTECDAAVHRAERAGRQGQHTCHYALQPYHGAGAR